MKVRNVTVNIEMPDGSLASMSLSETEPMKYTLRLNLPNGKSVEIENKSNVYIHDKINKEYDNFYDIFIQCMDVVMGISGEWN